MNEYQTVYIYQPSGIEIGHYFFFLMMVLLGFGIALLIKKTFKTYSLPRQTAIFFFGFIVGGTSIIFLIVLLIGTPRSIKDKKELKSLIESKNFNVVEGSTGNYYSKPYGGDDLITFSVNEMKFEYFDHFIQKGHNKTLRNARPINRNGQKVRISYVIRDNEIIILKIEAKQ